MKKGNKKGHMKEVGGGNREEKSEAPHTLLKRTGEEKTEHCAVNSREKSEGKKKSRSGEKEGSSRLGFRACVHRKLTAHSCLMYGV